MAYPIFPCSRYSYSSGLAVAHALEQRAPCHAASSPYAFDSGSQSLFVGRPAQALSQEVRGKEVLDPQTGDHGLLKSAEFPGQERCGFTGC